MIKLYHASGARSFRALWALEELQLPYELIVVPPGPRARFENYLEVNPLGTVPALFADGKIMTESAAIPHFLGTRYGPSDLIVGVEEPDYASYLNFLVMGEATLTFPQTIYLRYTRMEPPERRDGRAAQDYAIWFRSRLKAAASLVGDEFVCAGRFTMADISFSYALKLANAIGLADAVPAALQEYWQRLQQRPAYQRALIAQDVPVATAEPLHK